MNDAPRTENSSTPAKNSQDGVKKNNNGPKSASNSSFDDCPELITDSESESESDYDFDSEDCDSSEDENIEVSLKNNSSAENIASINNNRGTYLIRKDINNKEHIDRFYKQNFVYFDWF